MKTQFNQMPSMNQLTDQFLNHPKLNGERTKQDAASFLDILSKKQDMSHSIDNAESGVTGTLGGPRFSKHAMNRLSDRNLTLSNEQMMRLFDGTKRAGAKGINESLVLVDDLAFIVNIKNNTVVTALDSTKADESVYTNIDGAVIA